MAHSPRRGVGKNDSRYWRSKIFRRVDPRGIESAHYTARIQWRGRRHRFSLGTANKEAATAKAAAIWRDLVTHGLEATLAKHKPAATKDTPATATTIGKWIAAVNEVWDGNPSDLWRICESIAVHRQRDSRPLKKRAHTSESPPQAG